VDDNVPKRALLLFAKKSVDKGLAHPDDLAQLLSTHGDGLEASAALFEDLLFSISEDSVEVVDMRNNRPLTDYDVIYFRYWGDAQGPALAAARFCKRKGIPFIDSEVLRPGSFNKITQYMNLQEAGVPFPKTLVAAAQHLLANYVHYGFQFPLVLKSAGGTRGQDNYVARTEAQMREVLENNPDLTFVLQTFLPNDGDHRVVVMGDHVVMAIKRTASGDTHLNNTSQGGSAEVVPVESLPEEVRAHSVRAAQFFGRQVAGVDMVACTADGRWYCFEVNRAPQIEHASFEQQKAELLAAYLKRLAK
jgi:ribosomal protein S6--L-glutamate ligase